jgi:hypothetical protein
MAQAGLQDIWVHIVAWVYMIGSRTTNPAVLNPEDGNSNNNLTAPYIKI